MNNTLVYISTSAYESQVLNPLKEIAKSQFFRNIILLVSEKNDVEWNNLLERNKKSKISIVRFKSHPNYHFYNRIRSAEFKKIFSEILSNNNTIIHIRGEFFAMPVKRALKKLNLTNVKILSDVRGASSEETLLYKKSKPPFLQLKLYHQRKNLKLLKFNSDYISCVSEKLKKYLIEKSGICQDRIYINHCIAGDEFNYDTLIRDEYRKILKIKSKDILFLFMTGGNSNWQNTDEIINSIANNGYKILNLSRIKFKHENVINLFVPYNNVHNYLKASDISIVWRNDDVVNNVACPIKFSEYICSGLPVIANNGVDLINDYIKTTGYGITIKSFDDIIPESINRLVSLDRQKVSSYAHDLFSLKVISKRYISVYKDILRR